MERLVADKARLGARVAPFAGQRIEAAARHVPLENLELSPQCGFASTMEGNLLTEADQWAKLGLVVKVAREIWR